MTLLKNHLPKDKKHGALEGLGALADIQMPGL